MSWLFSRALVEEFSAANCSDGEPSAPSSGNPIPQAYCAPDKTTAFSRLSRFGMTFKPLTEDRGEELLMSYRAGFRARTSALPGKAQESMASEAECGSTWRGWLAKYDPATSSWRTAQCSFIEDLEQSLVTFPASGMTRGGLCWELPMLERRTGATGSGLWPTPTASMMPCEGTVRIMRKRWLAGDLTLEEASLVAGRDVRLAQGKVPAMWPTPTVCGNYNRKGLSATSGDGLATAVMKWATPTVNDAKNNGGPSQYSRTSNGKPRALQLNAEVGGALNPTWVEWLMGWPLGWTDLKPSATDKCHSAPQQPGACSHNNSVDTIK